MTGGLTSLSLLATRCIGGDGVSNLNPYDTMFRSIRNSTGETVPVGDETNTFGVGVEFFTVGFQESHTKAVSDVVTVLRGGFHDVMRVLKGRRDNVAFTHSGGPRRHS
jgi:hypothetical protein